MDQVELTMSAREYLEELHDAAIEQGVERSTYPEIVEDALRIVYDLSAGTIELRRVPELPDLLD